MATSYPQDFPQPQFYDAQAMAAQAQQFAQPPPYAAPASAPPVQLHDFTPPPAPSVVDKDARHGVYIVAGGVVGLGVLLAWVAVKNRREHAALRKDIFSVDMGLDLFIEEQAVDHAKVAQRQAAIDDYLSRNVDRIWTSLGVPWATRKSMPMESAPLPPMAYTLPQTVRAEPSAVFPSVRSRSTSTATTRRLGLPLVPDMSPSQRAGLFSQRSAVPASPPSAAAYSAAYEAEGLPSYASASRALEEATAFPSASRSAYLSVPSLAPVAMLPVAPSTTPLSIRPGGPGRSCCRWRPPCRPTGRGSRPPAVPGRPPRAPAPPPAAPAEGDPMAVDVP